MQLLFSTRLPMSWLCCSSASSFWHSALNTTGPFNFTRQRNKSNMSKQAFPCNCNKSSTYNLFICKASATCTHEHVEGLKVKGGSMPAVADCKNRQQIQFVDQMNCLSARFFFLPSYKTFQHKCKNLASASHRSSFGGFLTFHFALFALQMQNFREENKNLNYFDYNLRLFYLCQHSPQTLLLLLLLVLHDVHRCRGNPFCGGTS